ncbi:MAG TPA: hypothetical protein VMH91_02800 [Candidatus Paceibacterota bacterium]|nr:hypothetical protein [Candidatus Paceibacterota bacterium]
MLTDKDMNKLLSVFATKMELRDSFKEVKEEIKEMRDVQEQMLQAIDGLITPFQRLTLEYVAVKEQTSRHDRWIKRIAKRTGISLKE